MVHRSPTADRKPRSRRRILGGAGVLALVLTGIYVSQTATPPAPLDAGNTSAASVPAPASYSLWQNSTVPTTPDGGPDAAVEIGTRFQSSVSGYVVAIRFYKGSGDTGKHVGHLWTAGGRLLASVTFTGETASGWQQADFATPVRITASKTYVVSYHTNVGHYADDRGYFATAHTNGPLTAPAASASAPNGLYVYGAGGFPNRPQRPGTRGLPHHSWRQSSYYVDIVFTTGTTTPTNSPTGTSTPTPAPGAATTAPAQAPTVAPTTATTAPAQAPSTATTTSAPATSSAASGACPVSTPNAPGGPDPWGGCWPGPGNTGVPAGTTLQNVPQTVTSGPGWTWSASDQAIYVNSCDTTLSGLNVNGSVFIRVGNGTVGASTPCVTIKNSKINGYMDDTDSCQASRCGPVVMTDDEVDTSQIQIDRANVGFDNVYEWRINNHGGNGPDACNGNCAIYDSWEHGLVVQGAFHMNAVGSNGTGAGNRLTVEHNYLSCGWDQAAVLAGTNGSAGCTSDLAMLPDFDPVTLTAEYNYFAPAQTTGAYAQYQPSYCLYPGQGSQKPYGTIDDYIAYNVFARGPNGQCGVYGPIYGWDNTGKDSGNVWGPGNMWDNGVALNP
jgi:hypothetical protein